MHDSNTKTDRGFTLIELLVVIAIIALLLSIIVPTLGKAKCQAEKMLCNSQLKQLAVANFLYAENYNGRLPFALRASTTAPGAWDGWSQFIVPYLKRDESLTIGSNGIFQYNSVGGDRADEAGRKSVFCCKAAVRQCKALPLNSVSYGRNTTGVGYQNEAVFANCKNSGGTIFLGDNLISMFTSGTRGFSNSGPILYPTRTTGYPIGDGCYLQMDSERFPNRYDAPHQGYVNIAWFDGHCSSHKRMQYDSYEENVGAWEF